MSANLIEEHFQPMVLMGHFNYLMHEDAAPAISLHRDRITLNADSFDDQMIKHY